MAGCIELCAVSHRERFYDAWKFAIFAASCLLLLKIVLCKGGMKHHPVSLDLLCMANPALWDRISFFPYGLTYEKTSGETICYIPVVSLNPV